MDTAYDIEKAVRERHSVRQYGPEEIEGGVLEDLLKEIDRINSESGLRMVLVKGDPKAFSGIVFSAMGFRGARDYIVVIGTDSPVLNETAGYYGEQLVLFAQSIGLRTCWVMMGANKGERQELSAGERTVIRIAIGYGENDGVPHKSKPIGKIADMTDAPEWFSRGVEFAMLAPTGMNKQGFSFGRDGNKVRLTGSQNALGQIDKGIVRLHFELGAGKENFEWM